MIRTVAVEGNYLKTVYSCSCLDILRLPPRAVVSGFFIAHSMSTVPLTIASTYMGGEGENIGQRITPLITLENCVRGISEDRGTW